MTKLNYIALGACALVIAACGNPESVSSEEAADVVQEEEGVFDPMVGTMDKADAVNDIVNSRVDELNKRMEEAE